MNILKMSVVALSAAVIVGCGQKPTLPEGTVAAAYVDVQKAYASGKDVVEMTIGNLPKTFKMGGEEVKVREEAQKQYEEGLKQFETILKNENRKPEDFKWLMISVGDVERAIEGAGEPAVYLMAYVDGLEKMPTAVKPREKNVAGEAAYYGPDPFSYVILYKNHVLAASTESALEKLLQTYKGDKPSADNFGDLTALDGATVARLQVAGLADLFKTVKVPMPNGEKKPVAAAIVDSFKGIDDDMGEYLAEMDGLTLDVNLAKDNLGFAFSVVCGSGAAARLVEQAFGTIAIIARISADSAAVALREGTDQIVHMLPRDIRRMANGDALKTVRDSALMQTLVKTLSKAGRDIEVDRDGSVATMSLAMPLDDVVEDVISGSVEVAEKMMSK